jgi:hypothetical protein
MKFTVKKTTANDFSDVSVQAFRDIAATMKLKHSMDKMFWLLQMDGVSLDTKKNIQNMLLQEFCNIATVPESA